MTERSFDPDAPALDAAALQALAAQGMTERAASAFLEGTPPLLADLAAAVRGEDRARVVEIARRLRESCATVGASTMAERCAALEGGPPHAAASLSLAVSVEYRRAATALKAIVGADPPGKAEI